MKKLSTYILPLALSLTLLGCSKDDPTPQTGGIIGLVTPADALASVTATPATGAPITGTVNTTGTYSFTGLPAGIYTITYAAATGYVTPTPQIATVMASNTLTLPTITIKQDRPFLLTNKNWIETSNMVSPGLPNAAGVLITDLYGQYQPCDKDDFIRFEAPSLFKADEGPTKCNQGSAQTTTGTWVFNSDQTIITITPQGGNPISFNVTELTDSALKVNYVLTSQAGTNYTFTVVYRKG